MLYRKKLKLDGSYTVEAAFIVPIIFGILFAMMFMLFMLHDKVILYANIKENIVAVSEKRIVYKNSLEWQSEIQKNMWLFKVDSGDISDKGVYTIAKASAVKKINIPIISRYIDTTQKISYEVKYMKIRPEIMVRTGEVIKNYKQN